ncbi:MAG: hypothetical protein KAH08_03100 [Methylococcales bacterium]|nr:hypothetical protein [Methylococcales bacterium]
MINSCFLEIPPLKTSSNNLAAYEHETLEQWILELPVANPTLTTLVFRDFLTELNQTKMGVQLRLNTLETLKPAFFDIQDYLRSKLLKMGFPRCENGQNISTFLLEIEKEFTLGYWICVKELTKPRTMHWFQGKNTALSLQRTIKAYGYMMTSYYMMRIPIADWVWMDFHSLYKLSIQHKKNTVKVPDDLDHPSDSSSVTQSYIQILLLSLLDTATLTQDELQHIYESLNKLSALPQLEEQPIVTQALQCFVHIDEDMPPTFEEKEEESEFKQLYFNLTRLHKETRYLKKTATTGNRFTINFNAKLSFELLDYLDQCWLGKLADESACFVDRLDRFFSIGLENTYDLLCSNARKQHDPLEYRGESSSPQGLSYLFDNKETLSIGSLISFRKIDSQQNHRLLGVVSKITIDKHRSYYLEFNISLITAEVHAASFSFRDEHDESIAQKALFYQQKQETGEDKRFIIINSYLLKEQDIIELQLVSEHIWIELLNKKSIGFGYWRFECRQFEDATHQDLIMEEDNEKML